jgi:superfamily II DNA or RNA helicase
MIKITTVSPTKCYVENPTQDQLAFLKRELTYTDTSIVFALKKLKENKWLQKKYPETFRIRKQELEDSLETCMLQFDHENGKYFFYPGSIPYLKEKTSIIETCEINYPTPKPLAWKAPLPFDLYTYQKDCVEKLIEQKHGCVELCTGSGKSAIILKIARDLGLNTVIVTPSTSIFLEILEKFEHHLGKNNVGAYGDGKKKIGKKLTVCVSKSLTMLKPGSSEYNFFANADVVLGDESHTLGADTLKEVFHGVLSKVPYRFFLSGTQVRGDGKDRLLEAIIGKQVYSLTTKEAVQGGFICPVKFTILEVTSKDKNDIFDPLEAKRKHFLYNENIADLAAKIANSSWKHGQESTLILVDELKQIALLASRLTVPFEYVHSASKKDAEKFGLETREVDKAVLSFNKGEAKVLIGTSCIATGTNIFPTHNTINWVGGSSEVKTKQGAVGRSVRLLEKSEFKNLHKPKPFSKIYDFDVKNIDIMKKQLDKRIDMYRETCDDIKFVKV